MDRRTLGWVPTARPTVYDGVCNAPSPLARALAQAMDGRAYTACIDGSYKKLPTSAERLFSAPAGRSRHGASLVLVAAQEQLPPIVLHLSYDDHLGLTARSRWNSFP